MSRIVVAFVVVFTLFTASVAVAQNLSPAEPQNLPPAGPQNPPNLPNGPSHPYRSYIWAHRPSPEWTQDRTFTGTRFWLLDPGNYEFEVWFRPDLPRSGPADLLFQVEAEIGLFPHLQLDIYENFTTDYEYNADGTRSSSRGIQQEGNQIELRVAIPSYYGQIFGNPVLYFEWHPRHNAPDRAEGRVLLGGEVLRRLYLAVNLYYELNVESAIRDQEAGVSLGAGYGVHEKLRLGVEARAGGDELGTNTWHAVAFVGPSAIWKPLGKHLKIMGTWLFGLTHDSSAYQPTLIVATEL